MVVIGAGWVFFSQGDTSQDSSSQLEQKVLDIQDERLAIGEKEAPVKIVEYADVLCPYCAKVNEEVVPRVKKDYIDPKKAHYEIRLVAMIAPDSKRAAEGAYCAAEQNKFWDYMDLAYKETWQNYYRQNKSPQDVPLFSDSQINQFASRVGLELSMWRGCLDSGKYAGVLESNKAKMSEIEAYGTPHFLFNGQSYSGAPPYPFFQKALDAEYNKKVQG